MKRADRVRIVCMVALISATPCIHAGERLPESSVPFPVIFREPFDFVAVCVAVDEPTLGDIQAGMRSIVQRFRLLGLVLGPTGGRSVGRMRYRLSEGGFERAVRKGERVIWLARSGGKDWTGAHVFEDTPENRIDVYSRVVHRFNAQAHDGLEVRVETTGVPFARGQPIPVSVQIDNTSETALALWSDFSALQFEVLAEDGEPVTCRRVRGSLRERNEPLIVDQYRGPIETADLVDLCDWLPSGEQRSYTLVWRGEVRLGDRKAEPHDIVSEPIRLTVRDPSTLSWGAEAAGVAYGLAAEKYDTSMGDRMMFHIGIRSDTLRVDSDLHIYRYFAHDDEVQFTFQNIETKAVYRRVMDRFQGGPLYMPKAKDFYHLRDHPVLLWTIPVRLLDESGEQIPAGAYQVTATYESRHGERHSLPPNRGPWKLCRGPLVSAPVTARVQHADPESIEIWTNSAIELENQDGFCFWTGRQEDPVILRTTKRPGFGFHTGAVTTVAVGDGGFQQVLSGGYGGILTRDGLVAWTWESGFRHGLGPDACLAMAAGESLKVRVDVTIYETADTSARFFSPGRGDSRVVWQGRLEAALP